MLTELLANASSKSKPEQRRILEVLFLVETYSGNAKTTLQALERRRALGYRKAEQQMDAALQAATLLQKTNRFTDARAELIGILQDRRSLNWDGLLPAISLYVDLDERCREEMNKVLVEASELVLKKFGIPIPFDGSAKAVTHTIRGAHDTFRSDSRAYSELVSRAITEKTREGRERLISDIREFANERRAEFFNDQARDLLDKLTSKKGKRVS